MDGDLGISQEPAPPVVKDFYAKLWWTYVVAQIAVVVLQFVAFDFFGALMNIVLAVFAIVMVVNNCSCMNQICLLCFVIISALYGCIGLVMLLMDVWGRQSTQNEVGEINGQQAYITTVEYHTFFDSSMGFQYNLQSAMRVISPIVSLAACGLAFMTYQKFTTSLFPDLTGGGSGGNGNYGAANGGGGGGQGWGMGTALGSTSGGGGGGAVKRGGGAASIDAFSGVGNTLGGGGGGEGGGGGSGAAVASGGSASRSSSAGARGNSAQSRLIQQV